MNYWLLKSRFGMDRTEVFIETDSWKNFDTKYYDTVRRVQVGDVLLLAEESLINYFAVCVSNENDGLHISVNSWRRFQQSIFFPEREAFNRVISKINDTELIEKINYKIEEQKDIESIILKSIDIKNFTLFQNIKLKFSSGINVVIGENGTGKTQLMKLIYSIIQVNNNMVKYKNTEDKDNFLFNFEVKNKLKSIFKANSVKSLITKNKNISEINLILDRYDIHFNLVEDMPSSMITSNPYNKKALFIPAKEVLSFYTGFISIYNQTSFDETFKDLAINLGKLVPKNRVLEKFEKSILLELEKILDGKIILDNDRFYLLEKDENKREITLVAEGARKLGTIFHLLANGTIEKGSVIFWDEPESNLNPKYIKYVAKMLLKLEKVGIQIFIATHSLFLVNEIEILRKEESQVEYFSFGFDEKENLRVSQSSNLEELKDLVLLDEEIDQGDRFMMKESRWN